MWWFTRARLIENRRPRSVADTTALRRRIDTDAIPRLRQALDLTDLACEMLRRLDGTRSARLS